MGMAWKGFSPSPVLPFSLSAMPSCLGASPPQNVNITQNKAHLPESVGVRYFILA